MKGMSNNGFVDRSHLAIVATVGLLCVFLQSLDPRWHSLLMFHRKGILHDGEVWRLLSGHILHLGWIHLELNLLGLAMLFVLFKPKLGALALALCMVATGLLTSVLMILLTPNVGWMVGLSGLLHGMAVWLVLWDEKLGQLERVLWLLFIIGKVGWEMVSGTSHLNFISLPVGPLVLEAHLLGSLSGLVLGVVGLLGKCQKIRLECG